MNVHLHQARTITGWVLGIVTFSPFFALCFDVPTSTATPQNLSDVTGKISCSSFPINDLTLCLDSEHGEHTAFANLEKDGTFRLLNMRFGSEGALPGRYQAHLYSPQHGPKIPAKLADAKTSGVEIEIAPDWSDLDIKLD